MGEGGSVTCRDGVALPWALRPTPPAAAVAAAATATFALERDVLLDTAPGAVACHAGHGVVEHQEARLAAGVWRVAVCMRRCRTARVGLVSPLPGPADNPPSTNGAKGLLPLSLSGPRAKTKLTRKLISARTTSPYDSSEDSTLRSPALTTSKQTHNSNQFD